MYRFVRQQPAVLTKAYARRFLERNQTLMINGHIADRPILPRRVEKIVREMHADRFHSAVFYTIKVDGQWYRLNGQHTCIAIGDERVQDAIRVPLTLMEFVGDSMEDAALLWNTIDSYDSRRTHFDGIRALVVATSNLNPTAVRFCVTALYNHHGLFRADDIDIHADQNTRVKTIVDRYATMARLFERLICGKRQYSRFMRYVGVLSAIARLHLGGATIEDLCEFWVSVRDGVGLIAGSPQHRLREWLASGAASKDDRCTYAKCMRAWNAWVAGTTSDLKFYADKPLPEPIFAR